MCRLIVAFRVFLTSGEAFLGRNGLWCNISGHCSPLVKHSGAEKTFGETFRGEKTSGDTFRAKEDIW